MRDSQGASILGVYLLQKPLHTEGTDDLVPTSLSARIHTPNPSPSSTHQLPVLPPTNPTRSVPTKTSPALLFPTAWPDCPFHPLNCPFHHRTPSVSCQTKGRVHLPLPTPLPALTFRVRPQQVTHRPIVGHLLLPVNRPDLVQGLDRRGEAPVHTEDLRGDKTGVQAS